MKQDQPSRYKVIVHYLWYEDGKEKDLVPVIEEIGAEIIRQTPMRGLGAIKVWYKILHAVCTQEQIDVLFDYLCKKEGEQMIISPYNPDIHGVPVKVYN